MASSGRSAPIQKATHRTWKKTEKRLRTWGSAVLACPLMASAKARATAAANPIGLAAKPCDHRRPAKPKMSAARVRDEIQKLRQVALGVPNSMAG